MSDCGMAISNSSSTANMRFTIFRELRPRSLNCRSTGNGEGSDALAPSVWLTSATSRLPTPSIAFGSTQYISVPEAVDHTVRHRFVEPVTHYFENIAYSERTPNPSHKYVMAVSTHCRSGGLSA